MTRVVNLEVIISDPSMANILSDVWTRNARHSLIIHVKKTAICIPKNVDSRTGVESVEIHIQENKYIAEMALDPNQTIIKQIPQKSLKTPRYNYGKYI